MDRNLMVIDWNVTTMDRDYYWDMLSLSTFYYMFPLPIQIQYIVSMIEFFYYPILAIIGVPANIIVVLILCRGKCGLSKCITRYLVAMALSDLLVIVTEVILRRINNYTFQLNVLKLTAVCRPLYVVIRISIDCSVWFTVSFTFDRFVAISCQKLKSKYCTEKTVTVVLATITVLLCLKSIPIYFRYKPRWITDNVEWRCSNTQSYFRDPRWAAFRVFEKVLTPLLPFILILLCNTLIVRYILMANHVRKGLKQQKMHKHHNDQEVQSRRKSMVLLFTISGNFILLWLVYILYFFDFDGYIVDPFGVLEQVAYMLRNLSCCTNSFIYVATQSKFRQQLKAAVKYTLIPIYKLLNKQSN
ncbi:probable G-protein coupled receptor 139 [Stegostoma tigrinum]|uniref:probable G-protein coupled receptor 139 n=1 Tax=Stegostoma tigrinum TaxID=3053191 RepID=UPI0028705C49|nr:probable G-protein coupled receptor 139 [Stegostoma tigrinum]XP_059497980.1 probable G-protein coupled receptor 139 [Stegostoma tigrinum]